MISIVGQTVVDKYVTYKYVGKSTDTKPTAPNGSEFEEMDTGDKYHFDGDENGWFKQADAYLTSIAITTPPTTTTYVVGQDFDPTGMAVTASYTSGTTATVTTYDVIAPSPLTEETTSISVEYVENGRTRTASHTISVVPVALASIEFGADPTTTTYTEGDALDLTGAMIVAHYNNGDTETVTEECTFEPANGTILTIENTSVTATYTEGEVTKTASVAISVTPVTLESIRFVTTEASVTTYTAGDGLDLTGTHVMASYNVGNDEDVTDECTYVPDNGTVLGTDDTEVVATYTEGGVTKTATLPITVSALPNSDIPSAN